MMDNKALTVTALTKYIKYKFDHDIHLKDLLLEGEISNFKHNVRGHFYFTLKDDNASISAVMFSRAASKVLFKPKDGMHVTVRGYVSVFEVAGSYQIYVNSMNEVGLGNLYQAYLQLKENLEKKGMFEPRHKRPLPKFPTSIAVLTSATGAAVRDIIHIINRRYPLTKIIIYPTTVQGEKAKFEIVENIEQANHNNHDVIILGRGGGSIEDLWAFNEEMVAEAIFHSKTPIISAVGHETDFTIADFVADMRAPTPSGAAEIAVPDQITLHRDIESHKIRLTDSYQRHIKQLTKKLERYTDRYVLKDPQRLLMPHIRKFEYLDDKLRILHPSKRLKASTDQYNHLNAALNRAYKDLIKQKRQTLSDQYNHLKHVDPLSIMSKGYTLTRKEGKIIKSVHAVDQGDELETSFSDGSLKVKVLDIKEHSNE